MYNVVIEPSYFRKTICRIFCGILFCLFPKTKHLFLRSLMHISPIHMAKVYYEYKFKQPKNYKYFLSVLICVKDEAEYLPEWIEYYLLQGVEHFYIYNNNGTDNSFDVLRKYIDKGLITWIDYPGVAAQRRIYNDAIDRFRYETRWLAIVDCDEFIVPLKSVRIVDWLKNFNAYSQVLIHWCVYGSSGHLKRTKGLVMERFTKHEAKTSKIVKAILNPRAVVYANVHWHLVFGETVNEKQESFYGWTNPKPTAQDIRVNHYVIKSYEEYQHKSKRGDVNKLRNDYTDKFFQTFDKNEVDEPELMKPYVEKINSVL